MVKRIHNLVLFFDRTNNISQIDRGLRLAQLNRVLQVLITAIDIALSIGNESCEQFELCEWLMLESKGGRKDNAN